MGCVCVRKAGLLGTPAHRNFAPSCLQSGEHVKVVHGQHEGETGMVVRVEQPVAYVFTDASQQEIRVFVRDLTLAVAVANSTDS